MPENSKGYATMRNLRFWTLGIALLAAIAAAGCGKKAEQATSETSSDSLVASNPTERQSGDITPQTTYQEPPPAQKPPTPAPAPRPRAPKPTPAPAPKPVEAPSITMGAGTSVKIEITAAITSETAQQGDAWTGTVKENVIVGNRVVIPAGSTVNGVVNGSTPAKKGDRAMLLLGINSVNVDGKDIMVRGSTDSIIAGSTRARNVGTVGAGAAAGAVIGHAIGGSGKGSLIGGLIGAAATSAIVSGTKGYQVTIKPGAEITFQTDEAVKFKE
jgi:hypothetical protein